MERIGRKEGETLEKLTEQGIAENKVEEEIDGDRRRA